MTGRRSRLFSATAALTCLAQASFAGPIADFEAQAREAYAAYRNALFETNRKDKPRALDALRDFSAKWSKLRDRWDAAPPPHYADDPAFVTTLAGVGSIAGAAADEAAGDKLAASHETLEKIRDELASLRARNGVITFSDRMNAYHEHMERLLGRDYGGFDAAGLAKLREDAAVLEHLVAEIAKNPPREAAGSAEYAERLKALQVSVADVLTAARQADAGAAKQAVGRLKQPYSLLFLKFG